MLSFPLQQFTFGLIEFYYWDMFIREFAEDLDKLTLCYWKCFYRVLVLEECDLTTLNYLEAVKYSQIIHTQIDSIRQKVEEVIYQG